jgi:CBS domain-containing protein
MNVGQVCKRNVVTIRPFDGVNDAAKLMREQHVGYLIVVKPGFEEGTFRPVGVLTDRDIVVGVVARGVDPSTLTVEDVMTHNVVTANAADSIEATLPKMRKAAVRRVPIVGYRGELIGVLSLDDVFNIIAKNMQNITAAIHNEIPVEAVLRS